MSSVRIGFSIHLSVGVVRGTRGWMAPHEAERERKTEKEQTVQSVKSEKKKKKAAKTLSCDRG